MEPLIELLRNDSDARTYVEVACLYLSRRLLNGEFGSTTVDRFIASELADCAPKILMALEV